MTASTQVIIVGAGPYGLSIAAHLREAGIDFRIFGKPMQSWRSGMPAGMFLKSEGFASDLYDADRRHTLERFCVDKGEVYADYNCPVPLRTFTNYGLSFQRQLVPDLDERSVVSLERSSDGFLLHLDDGDKLTARQVVVATGVTYFSHVPESLTHLPRHVLSHTSEHYDYSPFKGRNVVVIGGGASAIDTVAALREAKADVRLVARRAALRWNTPAHRPGWKQWYPMSGLGGGWQNRFYENAPMIFRRLPQDTRMKIVRTWLGPAGAWPVRNSVEEAPLLLGQTLRAAKMNASAAHIYVAGQDGKEHDLRADHVIAATGYKVDLRNLPFLGEKLRLQLQAIDHTPILSAKFQSSVPGLHFVGLAAANTFGPVMRFLLGARYTARALAKHFANGTPPR